MIDLSIIIITFNSEKEIEKNIASIQKSENVSFEIIILDNVSKDQTIKKIKTGKNINIIKNKTNIGFAKACNQAVQKTKGKYLLFLNPDTIVEENSLNEMIKFLKKTKHNGIVGCKVINKDKTIQPSCGNFPTITNVIYDRIPFLQTILKTHLIRNKAYYQKEQQPDWISGVCMMMSKKTFLDLKGFDEKYFLYVEDVDLCFRAKKKNYKIWYTPNAAIYHKDMGKSKTRKPFKATQIRKGLTIFFTKNKSKSYCNIWQSVLRFESTIRPSMKAN